MTFLGVIWEGGIWREHEGEWGKGFPRPVKATSRSMVVEVCNIWRCVIICSSRINVDQPSLQTEIYSMCFKPIPSASRTSLKVRPATFLYLHFL